MPTAPGSEAVYCRSFAAHGPHVVGRCVARVPLRTVPQVVRQSVDGVALPNVPRRRSSALQDLHRPPPPGSEAVYCRSPAAHCPQALGLCVAGVPLPTASMQ